MQYEQIKRLFTEKNIPFTEKKDGANFKQLDVKFNKGNIKIEGIMRKNWELGSLGGDHHIFYSLITEHMENSNMPFHGALHPNNMKEFYDYIIELFETDITLKQITHKENIEETKNKIQELTKKIQSLNHDLSIAQLDLQYYEEKIERNEYQKKKKEIWEVYKSKN